jgi:hypothetical protein
MAMLPNPLPRLAADPTGSVLGLGLPPGKLIDTTDDGPWHEPLLWYADGPAAPDAWTSLLPGRAAGLHPVLIDTDHGLGGPESWELSPEETSYPGEHDPEEVLAELWAEYHDDDWPGLAPAREAVRDPDALAAEVAARLIADGTVKGPRAALVHARRSADIPAAIGWAGPLNHENDVARLCAVLRSWEDRFGIRVVALGFSTLTVSVAAPPRTPGEAGALAAEHYAFCPDTLDQGDHTTFPEYAEHVLLDRDVWHFWWD